MLTVKKFLYLITIFCFLATCFSFHYLWAQETQQNNSKEKQKAEEKQEKAPKQDQPQISLDSTRYDAGEVYEGDVIINAFTVKNTGTAQLNIEKVKAG